VGSRALHPVDRLESDAKYFLRQVVDLFVRTEVTKEDTFDRPLVATKKLFILAIGCAPVGETLFDKTGSDT